MGLIKDSLNAKILLITTIVVLVIGSVFGVQTYLAMKSKEYRQLDANIESYTADTAMTIRDPVYNFDNDTVQQMIDIHLAGNEFLTGALIYQEDGSNGVFVGRARTDGGAVVDLREPLKGRYYTIKERDILKDGQKIGKIVLYFTDDKVRQSMAATIYKLIFALAFLEAALVAAIYITLNRIITKPLLEITRAINNAADGIMFKDGEDTTTALLLHDRNDEVGDLHRAMDRLFRERTREISEAYSAEKAAKDSLEAEIAERIQAQEALKKSEERLQSILDNAMAVIFLKDVSGRYLLVNRRFEELFNVRNDQISGKTDYDIFPAEAADAFRKNDLAVLEAGRLLEMEELVPQSNGTHIYLSTKFPLHDANGAPYAICGLATDITERKRAETALLESERRYRNLIDIAPDAIFIADSATGLVIDANKKAEELLGRPREEIIGMHQAQLHPQEEIDRYREIFSDHVINGKGSLNNLLIVNSKGAKIPVDINAVIVEVDGRRLIIGIFRDVTERNKAEDALRDSESRLARASSIAHMGHWEWEPATGKLIWTDEVYHIFGYTPGEIEPTYEKFTGWVHPDDRGSLMQEVGASLEGPVPYNAEFRFTRRDGSLRYGQAIGNADFDSEGKPLKLSGAMIDITEHREAQEALRKSEERVQALLSNSNDFVLLIDEHNTYKFVSKSVEKITGYTVEEFISLARDIIHPDDFVPMARLTAKAMANPYLPIPLEMRLKNKDGKYRTYSTLGTNYTDNPAIQGIIVNFHDITERKEMEDGLRAAKAVAEEATRAKSDFLSTVSHELRTPLTSVLGFAKIIRKKLAEDIFPSVTDQSGKAVKSADQIKDNIDIIVAEGERLTALINEVLDLAKLESGKMSWNMQEVSVVDIIERAAAATSSLFGQKKLVLIKEIEENLPVVTADRDCLIQVVINLISNAWKFTDKGSVRVGGRLVRGNDLNGEFVEVFVTDTGIGIAKEDQEAIFEKFRQVGSTLTDKPKGTGLGLPICKAIVEHHGGRIWTESEPGKGSTFFFTVPV